MIPAQETKDVPNSLQSKKKKEKKLINKLNKKQENDLRWDGTMKQEGSRGATLAFDGNSPWNQNEQLSYSLLKKMFERKEMSKQKNLEFLCPIKLQHNMLSRKHW